MAFNYDRERRRKDGKQGRLIGQPIVLTIIWLCWAVFISWLNCWLTAGIRATIDWFHSPDSYQFLNGQVNAQVFSILSNGWQRANLGNYQVMRSNPLIFGVVELIGAGVMLPLVIKTWLKWRPNHGNQYGNDRLTTEDEVLVQYPQIPDRGFEYDGVGGIPVSHFKATAAGFLKHHPVAWLRYYLAP